MVILYGRAGRLTAKNGGCRPGQHLPHELARALHREVRRDADVVDLCAAAAGKTEKSDLSLVELRLYGDGSTQLSCPPARREGARQEEVHIQHRLYVIYGDYYRDL
jgi:hypothetical protein